MPSSPGPLRWSAQLAAALGLLSLSLTGEITAGWLIVGWSAWLFSAVADRFPAFLAALRRLETLAVITMVSMLGVDFFIFRNSIFVAVTHFLLLFQIVKLAGEKTRKDNLQIFLFAFFQILAACTLSVDAWHAAVLLALIPVSTAALFWNQIESENEQAKITPRPSTQKHYRRMAALICALALPLNFVLTLAVFILFPRLTFNASLPGFGNRRMGYTNQVNLAQKGGLQDDAAVVLWMSFPKPEDRLRWSGYLRGDALEQFDGREWTRAKNAAARVITPDSNNIFVTSTFFRRGALIRYAITLADTSAGTLFGMGRPFRVQAPLPSLQEYQGKSLHWLVPWNRPLHYEVMAEPFWDTDRSEADVQLPAIPLERIRALAERIAGNGTPAEQAHNIETYLQSHYTYTTSFGDRVMENPVDDFLFHRHEGLCGHFASAMALMLRLRRIPSRVVAGYIKGEWNKPAQCVVIRERNAHAWVEAYIDGQGWTSFDPSPRPEAGAAEHPTAFHRLTEYWDYMDLQWNRFVIQYDLYSQMKVFENLKDSSFHLNFHFYHPSRVLDKEADAGTDNTSSFPWGKMGLFFILGGAAVTLARQRNNKSGASPLPFYDRFLTRMARAGFPKLPHETGWEFAARIARVNPEEADGSRQITEKYYLLRFRREE